MALQELGSSAAVEEFVSKGGVLTFSAHWCGPCNASKPALAALAKDFASTGPAFGIVYESDLGDDIHKYNVRAFPTYALFANGNEKARVEGVNLNGIKDMVSKHFDGSQQSMPAGEGETLGGGGAAVDPKEARALRLAKLGGGAQQAAQDAEATKTTPQPMEEEPDNVKEPPAVAAADDDVEMKDADGNNADEETIDPAAHLDKELLKTLTESMGFPLLRAQKGLLLSNGGAGTVDSAVEWIMKHQDDDDIDEPIKFKVVTPLTAEEKVAKLAEIKELLKTKRAEREEAEKVDHTEREKQRRTMGKEIAKTKEQMDQEQRKRDNELRRKEKLAYKKERARIKAELERDKRERMANKGKLKGKLGVDGYNPDAIQYDVDVGEDAEKGEETETKTPTKPSAPPPASAKKIDEYITKVSSYRAGGDGGKCLKILKAYVSNVVNNPDEDKFKSINMDNKAYKAKVKPFIGAKKLLLAIGFLQTEEGTLHLKDDADMELLKSTKEKLEAAFTAFG